MSIVRDKESRLAAARAFLAQERGQKVRRTVSGTGSTVKATRRLREWLSAFLAVQNRRGLVKKVVDCPCGDGGWMSQVEFPPGLTYVGLDLVPEVVDLARENNQDHRHRGFEILDLVTQVPPTGDLFICRDLFQHLTLGEVLQALDNIWKSQPVMVGLTHWAHSHPNQDLIPRKDGWGFRPLNLAQAPFYEILGTPFARIPEQGKRSFVVFPGPAWTD